jgi:hypothetical protein
MLFHFIAIFSGVVCYNRPDMLRLTLTSLLNVHYINKDQITVYQDGTNPDVQQVAQDEFGCVFLFSVSSYALAF